MQGEHVGGEEAGAGCLGGEDDQTADHVVVVVQGEHVRGEESVAGCLGGEDDQTADPVVVVVQGEHVGGEEAGAGCLGGEDDKTDGAQGFPGEDQDSYRVPSPPHYDRTVPAFTLPGPWKTLPPFFKYR